MAKSRDKRAPSALRRHPSNDPINGRPQEEREDNPRVPADLPMSLYRTLKMVQMLMQATEQFLFQFSPFMDDETGIAARKLHGDIVTHQSKVKACLDRCEDAATANPADAPWEGGGK